MIELDVIMSDDDIRLEGITLISSLKQQITIKLEPQIDVRDTNMLSTPSPNPSSHGRDKSMSKQGSIASEVSKSKDEIHGQLLKEVEHYIEHKKDYDTFYLDLLNKVGKLDEAYIIEKFNMSTIKLNSL